MVGPSVDSCAWAGELGIPLAILQGRVPRLGSPSVSCNSINIMVTIMVLYGKCNGISMVTIRLEESTTQLVVTCRLRYGVHV